MQEILILVVVGVIAGIVGGMTGLGGGAIIVPTLIFAFGFSQIRAQGTSAAMLLFPIGILATYNYHTSGQINWRFAIILAFSFVIGGFIGSKVALMIDKRIVKLVFGVLMLLVSVKMLSGVFNSN